MAIPRSATAVAAIIAIALTGCAQPDPNAAPTYTCTPSTGTPQPCYKAEHDLQVKEDEIYAEAEAVYRKYLAEHERIYRAGGAAEATPTMKATLIGDALEERTQHYRDLLQSSTKAVGGTFTIGYLRREPKETVPGSVATLESCIDATSVEINKDGSEHPGTIGLERAFLSPTQDGLRISRLMRFDGEVKSCG